MEGRPAKGARRPICHTPPVPPPARLSAVPLPKAVRVWSRVALLSFGGPAGQIAVMHRILVEEKRWISEERFLHALNYCMLLPGPEAQQLAIYVGWLLNRTLGGVIAGVLFVLPGFLSILGLSILYAGFHEAGLVNALFYGLKPAVVAVVVEAVVRIGRRALKSRFQIVLAALSFVAIFFFQVPFPLIVPASAPAPVETGDQPIADAAAVTLRPSLGRSVKVLAVHLLLWWGPVLALMLLLGRRHVLVEEGVFFSKMSVVTFGGAYAALAYVAQHAVEDLHWLRPGEMLDGLGLAETTPGPLIMVLQFVGFLAAWRHALPLSPLAAGIAGSVITTWVTFVPCFLWIFLGAPYIEALRGKASLTAALSGVTAAVVGVILNLAVWFSLHTLFTRIGEIHALGARLLIPDWTSLDPAALVLALAAAVALFRFKVGMIPTLLASAALGAVWALVR
jgi:chromate transporter